MLCIVFKVPPNLIGSQYEKLIIQKLNIATVGTNLPETLTSMFYPIENTKEAYKLTEVSMEM